MIKRIVFISKDAHWQKYRLDTFTKLGEKYNIKVTILTTGKPKEYIKSNQYVSYIFFKSFFPLKWKLSLFPGSLFFIIKNKPDAVIALNNRTQLTEYLALFLTKIIRIKFTWWTHAYDHVISEKRTFLLKLKEFYTLKMLNMSNSIITFSPKGTEYLIEKGILKEKIFTTKNTLDTEKIFEVKEKVKTNRLYMSLYESYNIVPNDKIILFVGRLKREKNVSRAIYVLKELVKLDKQIKLVIIGSGEDEAKLKSLITAKIIKNVFPLGDIYDEIELAKWYTISKLVYIPSYVGLGIVHAFCYGLPFICEKSSNHGPELQYLQHSYNGYYFDDFSINDVASKINNLLQDPQLLNQMSQNALFTAMKKCNITKNIIDPMYLAMAK